MDGATHAACKRVIGCISQEGLDEREIPSLFRKDRRDVRLTLGLCAAATFILIWLISGPLFHFSDTWQLVVNTSTTIVTFLMVFLIQNTQNRDAKAMHLKLDELLRASNADNSMIDIEHLSDAELK